MVGPYHASKWALEGMIEAWRLELLPFGVKVVLIEPGPFADRSCTTTNGWRRRRAAEDSPYAELLASYRRQAAKIARAADLTPLIDRIERAATAANPGLRWPVGPTSHLRRPVARVLPRLDIRAGHADRFPNSQAPRQWSVIRPSRALYWKLPCRPTS